MVAYMPHIFGASIDETSEFIKEFDSLDELKQWIVDDYNWSPGDDMFAADDIVFNESTLGGDERLGWNNEFYVCIKRFKEEVFQFPQCIGYCSTDYQRKEIT